MYDAVAVVKGIADGIVGQRGRNAVNVGGIALIFPVRIGVTEAVGTDGIYGLGKIVLAPLNIVIFSFDNIPRAAVGVLYLLPVYRLSLLVAVLIFISDLSRPKSPGESTKMKGINDVVFISALDFVSEIF